MALHNLRQKISRHIDEDTGIVTDSQIPDSIPLTGSIGEVISLTPPMVELLSGKQVRVRAYTGTVPAIGQKIFLIRLNKWWIAFPDVTVV